MAETIIVKDGEHTIEVRQLSAVEKMRVYKLLPAGSEEKMFYLAMVFTACAVRTYDGKPVPWPSKPENFELVIDWLGDSGVAAVQKALTPPTGEDDAPTTETAAGNLPSGTSSSAALT